MLVFCALRGQIHMLKLFLALVGLALVLAKPAPTNEEPSCGYETCHPVDENRINIHLVPHSHDDVGWLKTVDQYFYGAKIQIQRAGVQYIITTAVEALLRDKNRRYIQVETEFFKKWWEEATDSQREDFKYLVNRGQLEMINGAFSMNDEACTNYQSTIDQFTWGLRFLNDTLGACGAPKIGWQIDPFGHSKEQANLFAQFGYNGFFFARLDENDRKNRKNNKRMDFMWQGSDNLEKSNIFGSVFGTDNLYFPPQDLNWDVTESNDPIIDNPNSPDYNVPFFLNSVEKTVKRYKEWFPTKNILFPMGGDFQYQSAEMLYMNMDRLIKMFKNHSEINVIYSTPSCYLKAVNDAKPTLKLKTDDFFPYGNSDHEYWAGYFTSRPNSKRFERVGNNILQATKQLTAFSKILTGQDFTGDLDDLREQMGIMQHHDAITGTEKEHVVKDYVRRLTKGIKNAEKHFPNIVGSFITSKNKGVITDLNLQTCLMSNVSICTTLEKNVVVVYNPLSRPVSHYVRIPVPEGTYQVFAADAKIVPSDLLPSLSKFEHIPEEVGTPLPYDLVFECPIHSLGMYIYYIEKIDDVKKPDNAIKKNQTKFGTEQNGFELDPETNLLKSVTINTVTTEITQEFLYYDSARTDIFSGAYLFRPLPETSAVSLSKSVRIESITSTDSVDEVIQVFNEYIKQIIRVYKADGHSYVEFDWLVGPLPDLGAPHMGHELITRFTVKDFDNKNVFYTDSNGRQLMRREINKRPDYTYDDSFEPIASNYYPVTSRILIRDEAKNLEVAVLNDRSQGGTSLNKGQIELMVHRRLFHDDNKGVNENLNEIEFGQGVVVRGSHWLTLGKILPEAKYVKTADAKEKVLELKKLLSPLVIVSPTEKNKEEIFSVLKENSWIYEGGYDLPEGIHVMTFEPWKEDSYILRLENMFDLENSTISVYLDKIFANIKFSSIRETTLAANHWLEDYEKIPKFSWNTDVKQTTGWSVDTSKDDGPKIALRPSEIRTFIVKV